MKSIVFTVFLIILNTGSLRAEDALRVLEPGVFFNYYSLSMGVMPADIKPILYKNFDSSEKIADLDFGRIVFSAIIPYIVAGRAFVGTQLSGKAKVDFGWVDEVYLGHPISSERMKEIQAMESELLTSFKF